MSIKGCIDTLVSNAKITAAQGRDAKAIYDEHLNDDLLRDMAPAAREAAAALRTAKFLAEDAHARKLAVALKVNRWIENTRRIDAHPVRPLAGHNALYDRDSTGHGGVNLAGLHEYYKGLLASKIQEFTKTFEPKLGGLKQDTHGIRGWVHEVKGVDTGDPLAKATAAGWKGMKDFADKKNLELDPTFRADPENVLPQFWESSRVQKFGRGAEFKNDVQAQLKENGGGLSIFDNETRAPAKDAADRARILDRASLDIQADASHLGASNVLSDFSRTFRFSNDEAGAKSYLALMDKYGVGQGGYFAAMQAHAGSLARELALKHQFGPNYVESTKHLLAYAIRKNAERLAEPRPGTADEKMRSFLTGKTSAIRLQQYATGQLSNVESKMVKAIFDGARGLMTATKLGSALVTALPADPVFSLLRSNFRGLNSGRLIASVARNFAGIKGAERDALAARLGIVSHAGAMDAIAVKRFGDQLFGEGLFKRLGSFVVHASGLAHWDDSLKLAFPMEFLGTIGDNAGKAWGELNPAMTRFLKDYGFSEAEWARMAAADNIDTGSAKFMLPSSLDEPLRIKLLSAMADEKQFGYIVGGSMRGRALATGGARAGTISGELSRSAFQFQNFAVSVLMTHLKLAAQEASQGRFGYAASLLIGTTIAGAMTLQAKSLLSGKDPLDMSDWQFWPAAALQGGAAGYYGDFLKSASSRSDTSLLESGFGPIGSIATDTQSLLSGARAEAIEGEKVNWGTRFANFVKHLTPGSNIWYTKLLFDRFVVDTIKQQLDPNYMRSFRREEQRQQKLYGQQFYWPPGASSPSRAPDPGAAFQ